MSKLSDILQNRGYVHQHSSPTVDEITDGQKRTLYLGIDPSADSLQVGQLQAFLVLRHFLEDGHKIILVIGGGTGVIGDPGGKSAERVLLPAETAKNNSAAITKQVKQLFNSTDFTLLNNADWLGEIELLDFLRDIGKHFSVNVMLQRDFIRDRVERPEQGISYTEFSYALLQAYDYYYLHKKYNCDLQLGGSDQWGNIVSGIDLIRRKEGKTVYGLTWPLLVDKSGKKFGKSESETVWLDPVKTSPFKFYQFWLNTEDESVGEYLLKMTMLSNTDVNAIVAEHKRNPGNRSGQKILAHETTAQMHGEDVARAAEDVSEVLFGQKEIAALSASERDLLKKEAPLSKVRLDMLLVELLVESGLATSKREARQFIDDGAVTLNGGKVSNGDRTLLHEDFQDAPLAILKRGKRNVVVLTLH